MRLHRFNKEKALRKIHFKQNKNKYIKALTLVLSILVLVFFIVYFSFSQFSTSNKFNVIQTTVGDFSNYDYSLISYINGTESTTFPQKSAGYVVSKVECTNGATGVWDSINWNITISNTTSKGNKCSVYFNNEYLFDYTGSEQIFTAPYDGYYKLETWGAQGGTNGTCIGGYGAYSVGILKYIKGNIFYINVGGSGIGNLSWLNKSGGYNGGGLVTVNSDVNSVNASGGGATHISNKSGLLSSLIENSNSIFLVSGAGGGSGYNKAYGCTALSGAGGGISGNNSDLRTSPSSNTTWQGGGGTQSSGGFAIGDNIKYTTNSDYISIGTFGQGGGGTNIWGGAGGGYYGGSSAAYNGGGGSGYIGNSLLLSSSTLTKHMTCYNCATSSDNGTRTNTTTNVSETPKSDYAKIGNGYVKITYLGSSLE
jgi:hypothetical protein